ncbi:MAG TPA: bifunctional diguanylate cyclase/phosphodiesterase [Solirubrobacteraceae bacterium]|nr:bifunctional diguanylate cyclase/phosphodiesterase [Solirubrobacteraceae bacterium]
MPAFDESTELHDPLTELPSRVLLADRLEHALARARRPRTTLAVLFVGVDNFKQVNDSLGHDAGDDLLLAIKPRLLHGLRPGDTVARFGSDEFVVVCENLASEAAAVSIAKRVLETLSAPIPAAGTEHFVSASIGIVVVEGGGTAVASEVLRDAGAAMHRAKQSGGARWELHDASMRRRLLARVTAERELREAVGSDQLRLYYQPLVALEGPRVIGAEALVRWEHPTRGLLLPGEFIPLAEETGAILSLGKWVIETAIREGAQWQEAFPEMRLSVSLNLSARQVAQAGIPRIVREILRETGVNPAKVELEITESALIDGGDVPGEILGALKDLGVRLVLDDFGTGYSSLSYLKRFPIDAIKIDRSFIAGLGTDRGDTAIVAAVINMARALGISVIAEGVENEAQAGALRTLGCHYAQGFHYSPAVPADVFGAFLTCAAADMARQPVEEIS